MRKALLVAMTLLMTVSAVSVNAQNNKDRRKSFKSWDNYEITTEKVGVDGTKFVKVWGYGKNVDAAVMQAKKNAVHACIFRGLPGSATAMATPAICPNPDTLQSNEDYFQTFFAAGGPYLAYINMTTDGVPSGTDRRQVKGGYKVGIYVQVMYDNLKRKLEADGIARKLSSGF
ncbi:MAG: hypothetical protein IKH11_05895 [Bacteroidales bacterium]|nr:hypothetical protein [Bacteroidales bacterium]